MELLLEFNCKKSCCILPLVQDITIAVAYTSSTWCSAPVWNSTVKYLGIVFSAGTSLNVDTDVISRKFYSARNNIFTPVPQV